MQVVRKAEAIRRALHDDDDDDDDDSPMPMATAKK
jgi:hypothetical protein